MALRSASRLFCAVPVAAVVNPGNSKITHEPLSNSAQANVHRRGVSLSAWISVPASTVGGSGDGKAPAIAAENDRVGCGAASTASSTRTATTAPATGQLRPDPRTARTGSDARSARSARSTRTTSSCARTGSAPGAPGPPGPPGAPGAPRPPGPPGPPALGAPGRHDRRRPGVNPQATHITLTHGSVPVGSILQSLSSTRDPVVDHDVGIGDTADRAVDIVEHRAIPA